LFNATALGHQNKKDMENFYEQLLQRSNGVANLVAGKIRPMKEAQLTWKEKPKKWSLIEVVSHLNKVYDKYLTNFEKAVSAAPNSDGEPEKMQRTLLGKLSVYSMKPKGRKRRFKMKTFDFFQPDETADSNEIIETFLANKEKFNALIREARLRNLKDIKMPTALGEKMKFYVPECFDFVMAHEERHVVQLQGILEKVA